MPLSLLRERQRKIFLVVNGKARVFSLFFLVIIKNILSKTMHVVIIKMKFQKKQDCMKLIFISFGTDLIKLKLWLMVLTVCFIQKETKRRKKETNRWIQMPLVWVLTLRGSQINQWVREKAVRCNPEYWWQKPSVCLPVFWDHHQGMRSSTRPEKKKPRWRQPLGPVVSDSTPQGHVLDTQALVFISTS